MKLNKMREEMANTFIAALKEERIPWHRSWTSAFSRPMNAISNSTYRGLNMFWLSYVQVEKEYKDPRWCTYKQAQEKGWNVKKGEKGTKIEFWSMYDTETKQNLNRAGIKDLQDTLTPEEFQKRVKPNSKVYTVFNGEQIEGIPELVIETHNLDTEYLLGQRDVLLKNMNVNFLEQGWRAYYSPDRDLISLPKMEEFENEYAYISTLLHEAGHATGHIGRLNRDLSGLKGSPKYAREELRVEIASAFTSQMLNIDGMSKEHMENHKAYIQSWIQVLEEKPEELFSAIKDAERISDYLIEKGEFEIPDLEMKEALQIENTIKEKEQGESKRFYHKEESENMVRYLKENLSIVEVCKSLGYTPVRVGQAYYSIKEHDSVRLDIRNNSFYWNSTGDRGSVVDVCTSLGNMSKADAFTHLYEMAGGKETVYETVYGDTSDAINLGREAYMPEKILPKGEAANQVELPQKAANSRNVYAYLGKTRQVSSEVITEFFKRNMLYQDVNNNCVFVSYDKNETPVFACKRGTNTYQRFVGDCKGNDYNKGFYVDNGADKLFVAESVIDIMSKMSLMQEEGADFHEYNYLAMAGTQKQNPIENALNNHPEIREVTLGLDNDKGGHKATEDILRNLEEKDLVLKVDMSLQDGSDWNDALIQYKEGIENGKILEVHREETFDKERRLDDFFNKGKDSQYVYTEWGEKKAKEYGVEPRKAGEVAMFGGKPLQDGITAKAWEEKGYITKKEKSNVEEMTIEQIYQKMTDVEKEVFDLARDYNDREGLKIIIEGKRRELQKEEKGPLLNSKEAAKLRLIAKGREMDMDVEPVYLQIAKQMQKYQDNGLSMKEIIIYKMDEIVANNHFEDKEYIKDIVCSIGAKNREEYDEFQHLVSTSDKVVMADKEMSTEERLQSSIFTPIQVNNSLFGRPGAAQKVPIRPQMKGVDR